LNRAFGVETVGEMRPSSLPTRKRINFHATVEHVLANNALGVDVIGDALTLGTVPDAKLCDIKA
jgi:hypothetical protein